MTPPRDRAGVLARAREALAAAGAPGDHPIVARGGGDSRGLPVTWTRAWDAAGRVVLTVAGPLGHATGFDGARGWRVDETGMPGALELGDLEELIVSTAAWDGAWCRDGGPVTVEDAVAIDGARVWLTLRARGGHRRFRLAVDPRTGLATRLERAGRDDAALELADHRPTAGGLVPHLAVWREGWLTDTLRVESVGPAPGPVDYAPPHALPDDTAFDPSAVVLEQRWTRGRLPLVRARIDDRDAGWFALDTGASACAIEAGVAARLKLPELGRRFVRTADGAAGAPYRRAGALRVGAATIRGPLLLELDLEAFGRAAGAALAGVLGYDLFQRALVTLDREAGVAIAPPGDDPAGGGDWLPLSFEDGLPVIAARYPGPDGPREGLFAIDTGSAIALTIAAGAAPSFALRGGARVALRGAGGSTSATARRLAWLELAGHRVEGVEALVARPGAGALGDPEPAAVAGLIGMGLLRDFAVTFDYRRRRLRARYHGRG